MNASDTLKPRRRWYQFRVRTMLVFVVVAGIGCGWFGNRLNRARKNRLAAAAVLKIKAEIESLGGSVQVAYQQSPNWLQRTFGDPGILRIERIDVTRAGRLTDAGLEHLENLTSLRILYVGFNQVTDAGLEHLKGLTSLRELSLYATQVSGPGLEHLKGLTGLEKLWLGGKQVTDAGLEHLEGLTNLQELYLDDTGVTDAGLEHLNGLANLQALGLSGTRVTDQGVKKLQQALPNCKIHH